MKTPGTGSAAGTWIAVCLALVLVISLLDYYSGPDITFSLFYFAVIVLYAWNAPALRHALIGAVFISIVWLTVGRFTAGAPAGPVQAWNAAMRLIMLVGLAVMVCRLKETLANEQSMARSDFLTATLNSRAFAERAKVEIARARRTKKPLTVAYIDVDDFKTINDRFGHSIGDAVLRTIAEALKANLRETDIISRVGGDEFVILLPATNADQARTALSKLHAVVSATTVQSEHRVSLSIGAVVFDEPPAGVDALTKASDAAMYHAKSTGKNAVHIRCWSAEPA